jgi:hypothetical protein
LLCVAFVALRSLGSNPLFLPGYAETFGVAHTILEGCDETKDSDESKEGFAGPAGRQQRERAARSFGAAEAVCAGPGTMLPVAMAAE